MSSRASARRGWRERTRRAVAREQGRCSMCNKEDRTGLMDGKCTACWVQVQNGPSATA